MADENGAQDYVPMADGPTFDLEEMSWKDQKFVSLLGIRLEAAQEGNDAVLAEQIFDELQAYLGRFVVSVPRSMVVKRAPADLKWDDPESYDYLRRGQMSILQQELSAALKADREN